MDFESLNQVKEVALVSLTETVFVGARNRHQEECLAEAGARRDWAALAGLQACDMLAELRIDHGHFAMLDNEAGSRDFQSKRSEIGEFSDFSPFNAFHGLARVVGYDDVSRNLFAVIVNLAIQGALQVDLALGESEALADQR